MLSSLKTISIGKKKYYVLPISDISRIGNVNKNTKFYIEIDAHLSRNPVKASRLKDMRLIKGEKVLKGKDAKKSVNFLEDAEGLDYMLSKLLFVPVETSKMNYDILGISLNGNNATMVPYKSIVEAAEETLSSLYEMVELIPKRKKNLFRKIYPYIEQIEDFL